MQFICQVRLYPELFGPLEAQMAYVFMTDNLIMGEEEALAHGYADTADPDAGENAVILQPGVWTGPTLPLAQGPSLYKRLPDKRGLEVKAPCEYAVETHPGEDAETLALPWPDPDEGGEEEELDDEAWIQRHTVNPTPWDVRWAAFREDKIGGIPVHSPHYDAFPYPDQKQWQVILQVAEDTENKRFSVNFGSDGMGYALLSEDGRVGKFLWTR